jgi:hypothetical protein
LTSRPPYGSSVGRASLIDNIDAGNAHMTTVLGAQ